MRTLETFSFNHTPVRGRTAYKGCPDTILVADRDKKQSWIIVAMYRADPHAGLPEASRTTAPEATMTDALDMFKLTPTPRARR
jgi:hypothetical protein